MSGCQPWRNNASQELCKCRCKCEDLQKQINALTEMYKEISLKHVKLMDFGLNKKPYKCRACDGKGIVFD